MKNKNQPNEPEEYRSPDRTKNRSDKYQQLFAEVPHSSEMIAEQADSSGMVEDIPLHMIEEYHDLKDNLREEFWRVVDENLTPRQASVLKLWCQGYTQIEIAKKLNVNQSSITKSINGNCDYRNSKKIYGGSMKRLRLLARKDEKIHEILLQINDLFQH